MSRHETALNAFLPADPMADVATLAEMLERRARLTPGQTAVVFGENALDYAGLWRGAGRFAAYLRAHGLQPGDRAVLRLANSAEFFFAYYGTLRLGATAVPIFHGSSPERTAKLANHCGARVLVCDKPLEEAERLALRPLLAAQEPALLDLAAGTAFDGEADAAGPSPDDLAMLQYTSGTTGDSKGVRLTHANLLANIRQMIPAARFVAEDVFVSWLPVYHDMGLITMTMCPFYLGAKLVLLPVSPKAYPWLNAIKTHRGTFTAAPDFGYRFCVKFSKSGDHYDLSSLKRALIAAEPVRESTVRRFEGKFGVPGALKPGYGLAEASVAATFWDMDRTELKIDDQGHISAGKALPGMEVAIVDDHGFAPPGEVGEIAMRGPSCTAGYYRNPEATRALGARDGFIRTGDLGYLDEEGDLFIVGRAKNIIIRAGRNLAPREIEEVVEELPEVRFSAAVGMDSRHIEGEQIHVFAEVDRKLGAKPAEAERLSHAIVNRVRDTLGYRPDKVWLVRGKTIPRTFNGKIQYGALKAGLSDGLLRRQGSILYPPER